MPMEINRRETLNNPSTYFESNIVKLTVSWPCRKRNVGICCERVRNIIFMHYKTKKKMKNRISYEMAIYVHGCRPTLFAGKKLSGLKTSGFGKTFGSR